MGRRNAPSAVRPAPARLNPGRRALSGALAPARALALGLLLGAPLFATAAPAAAQTLADRIAPPRQDGKKDRLLVQAREMIYDSQNETVTATKNVQLYYQGRVLEADRVVYDRRNNRVQAQGRVRLTETDGTVSYADRLELTDDFKTGFIDTLRSDTADNTYLTAARAERIEGETTVFERGTYTACEPCKDDPSKPPLWQIRAKRVIHQNSEQTIYYEDATVELFGMPVAYLPFFSSPDQTVKRKTGWLTPHYIVKDQLGFGVAAPFFWNISPSMDLTLTPTILSKQGLLADVEFRQRLINGSYSIRVAGIMQADPGAFKPGPYGPGDREFRGTIDTAGEFWINKNWRFGWDVGFASDKWFTQDYKQPSMGLSANYFRERTSQVYLNGQSERAYFDLRGYYFQGLANSDRQELQPLVAPVLDYNKTFDLRPERFFGIGGQVELDFNLTSISRQAAAYESIKGQLLDPTYQLYDVCAVYDRQNCLLRGMAGEYTRATLNASWKRQFIDPIGNVWTPFTFAHLNGSWLSLDKSGAYYAGGALLGRNVDQMNFVGSEADTFRGRALAGAGVEYRLPLMARTQGVTHVVEPIAQVIVRPDEVTNRTLVNEDSQSLVFDDTNLFSWNKYSGYDRFEGGVRANYGVQYTASFDGGGYANLLVGQSYQLAGRNSYASPDAANIGLASGLDSKQSDYVTRAVYAPNLNYTFIAKGRFDPDDFHLRRLDLAANARWGQFTAMLQYARYEAQPELGYDKRREGISAGTKYNIDKNFYVTGNVIFDMSRHLYPAPVEDKPLFSVAGLGVGGGYTDECATLSVNYTSIAPQGVSGATSSRNQTVLVQLQLRTLGDARISSSVANLVGQDGTGR